MPAAATDVRPASPRAQARIEREVTRQLLRLPYFGVFDNMAFRVNGYHVTLMGQVTRPTLRQDAEAAVRRIEGVESVTNRIEILPLSPFDDRIRLRAYQAIYGHSALNRYALNPTPPIRIIVKNGHVTLEGVVASKADRTIAFVQANGISGVFSVTNHLRVGK